MARNLVEYSPDMTNAAVAAGTEVRVMVMPANFEGLGPNPTLAERVHVHTRFVATSAIGQRVQVSDWRQLSAANYPALSGSIGALLQAIKAIHDQDRADLQLDPPA